MKFKAAIIDIETGGFHKTKNGLAEIGIMFIDENQEKLGEFSWLIKPYRMRGPENAQALQEFVTYDEGAVKLHGLNFELLSKMGSDPAFVAHAITSIVKHHNITHLIGHNIVGFDWPWLDEFFTRFGPEDYKWGDLILIDTLKKSKEKIPAPSHSLQPLCAQLGIQTTDAHRALGDVRATYELYKHLCACGSL